jgi:hypothetical protein
MGCTPVRYTPYEVHAHDHEVYACIGDNMDRDKGGIISQDSFHLVFRLLRSPRDYRPPCDVSFQPLQRSSSESDEGPWP